MSLQTQSGVSRRSKYFYSALELAIAKSAHEWKFEDFEQCFPQYVEEDKEGARQTFAQVANYIESTTKRDLEKIFEEYELKKNVDILDKVVSEARARRKSGEIGPNVWTENLQPRSGVRGRGIPILEAQAKRLGDSLAKLEAENLALLAQLEEKNDRFENLTARSIRISNEINETHETWKKIPMDVIHAWTAQAAETLTPVLRS
ncbi:hypothetical protein B0H11DRAFT_1968817 [Mycena galericulata]|nr:hypothetical protein B0H11DRAFT_1968817 [Mycena galericulata]